MTFLEGADESCQFLVVLYLAIDLRQKVPAVFAQAIRRENESCRSANALQG